MPKVRFTPPPISKPIRFSTIKEEALQDFCDRFILTEIRFTVMSTLTPQSEATLSAFVTALAQQDESLPQGLQQQLYSIGQNLEARVVELPVIAASLPKLNQAYQAALSASQAEGEQGTVLVSANQDHRAKLFEHAAQIFTDSDPVHAAQRHQSRGVIASNPLKNLFRRG